ncbi:MAG: ABC-2 family transporter protein [Oscillospiraceae bacterium]|jgi:ABC-2 type transport system permease protein|nr:ABC-2 family transporter protein [Oscillospiraceae bacterium]
MRKYIKTAHLAAREKTNGGVVWLLPEILIKAATLVPLLFLWRAVLTSGAGSAGMSVSQILSYTTVSALLSEPLTVQTKASGWLSEGVILKLYGRPLPVLGQLAAQTVGGWLPNLALFSLPTAAIAVSFGVNLIPASPLFPLSLLLCVSLGFAVDLLFSCLALKLRSIDWLISRLRQAVAAVLSGTVIPIRLLPFGVAEAVKLQPFASLGGAPLSVFIGSADTGEILVLQILWNLILWPAALLIWRKSREGMVSYGG